MAGEISGELIIRKCIFEVALTVIQPIVIIVTKEFQVLKRLYATLYVLKYDNEMLSWAIYPDQHANEE